ncbi:MAG: hypothetical protein ABIG66_05220 [Candidatus Kerfeldbacteria bacterium]
MDIPTPPAANAPENTFETTGTVMSTSNAKMIDFDETIAMLQTGIEYLQETRSDFETTGPQKWISDTADHMNAALDNIQDLETNHMDDLAKWKNESGEICDVLVRMQDEAGFDEAVRLFTRALDSFDDYFNKHINLLKSKRK